MKYMIIEDELLLSSNLSLLIKEIRPGYELKCCVESVEEAVEILQCDNEIDLIFMDIRLADGLCFEIFKEIDVQIPVIFTTAFNDYLPEAFKAICVDYLLKPITRPILEDCLDRFESKTDALRKKFTKDVVRLPHPIHRNRIVISNNEGYKVITIDDVAYFLSQGKYVFVIMKDGSQELTDFNNLSEVQTLINPERFFVASRNMVIAIDAIVSIKKHYSGRLKVELSPGPAQEVFISIARKKQFIEWLNGVTE